MSGQGGGQRPETQPTIELKAAQPPTQEFRTVPDAAKSAEDTVRAPAPPDLRTAATRPAAPPEQQPSGPAAEDLGLASKLQDAMKARTFEKGQEAAVIKLADIIKIVRDMLGASAGKSEAQLQDEIVRLKLQINNLTAQMNQQLAAERSKAQALEAELRSLRADHERLKAEIQRLTVEVERLTRELAEARAALAKETEERKTWEERARRLEELLGASGRSVEDMIKEREELVKFIADLEEQARSARSDVRYAQLIEEPAFVEVTAACAELEAQAAKAPAAVQDAAQEAAALAAAAARADGPAFKKLLDEVFAKRGSVQTVARLEVLAGVHHALRNEIDRWRRATAPEG